jgi:flagellar basal-body rod protein FlgB
VPSTNLFSGTIAILEKSLDLRSRRHQVLASNIANIDTPNYKAFDLVIEEEMANSTNPGGNIKLVRTQANHLAGPTGSSDQVTLKRADPPGLSLRADGNTVDLDKTMGDLAENTLLFKAGAQIISEKFQAIIEAIKGGK